jgi:hypothetical protein
MIERPANARNMAIILIALLFSYVPSTLACGPFALEAVFTFKVHPEYPLELFAGGRIGVVQPLYARSYLYVAYRHLSGSGFNEQAEKALVALWSERLNLTWAADGQAWVDGWLTARSKIPGVAPAPKIDVYRNREKPNEYETYLNCQKDAFENAAATLTARMGQFGADSAAMREWVEAQDQVFSNCSEGQHFPHDTPPDADPLLKADRAYQIAAANFYSGNFAAARTIFQAIAAESSSPWHDTSPYLIARTLLRQASLGPPEGKNETLREAETTLEKILQDAKLKSSHAAADRLLGVVRLRLYPDQSLRELAHTLLTENDAELKQHLWDYTLLLDSFLGDDESAQKKEVPAALRRDDLTDWLLTFQSSVPDALAHALERWEARASLPWLVATLSKIDVRDPKLPQLLAAAAKVKPESPAFPSLSFHTIRLAMAAGRFEEARAKLDELLQKYRSHFDSSGLNLLLSQRMILAKSLDDFLTYAQRLPAGLSFNDDGREIPAEPSEESAEVKSLQAKSLFDVDAAQILNREFPLTLLRQAADSKVLPHHLRRDLVQAAWLRAVLLGDLTAADTLVPGLESLVPEITDLLNDFQSATPEDVKRFAAIYVWLKFPGLEPIVDSGIGRQGPLGEQDIYRDNWWCAAAFPNQTAEETGERTKLSLANSIALAPEPSFVTSQERAQGEKESATLAAMGAAPNYICRQVIQYATKNPTDGRVPEALHLAVKTTRHGCTDKQTGRWSKAAFDLLHKQYPNSVWAKRTPYWFKD